MFFKKKIEKKAYDKTIKKPIIKASICTGEQVAGFLDNSTGKFVDIMVIRGEDEVEKFRQMYGIKGEIKKEY